MIFIVLSFIIISSIFSDEKICLSQLPTYIDKEIALYNDWRVGVSAMAQKKGEKDYVQIYSHDENHIFLPASNTKVMTTSSMLLEFGEEYEFQTDIYSENDSQTLCIRFTGDPSIEYNDLLTIAHFINGTPNVLLDFDSFLGDNTPRFPHTWQFGDLVYYYGAAPEAAIVNINHDMAVCKPGSGVGKELNCYSTVSPIGISFDTSRTSTVSGTERNVNFEYSFEEPSKIVVYGEMGIDASSAYQDIAIPLPRKHIVDILKFYTQNKINIEETTSCNLKSEIVKTYHSDKLVNLMNYTLLVSDNTYAELFLRQIGAKHGLSDYDQDSQTAGLRYIQDNYLNKVFGISESLYRMNDGSGVSRQTHLSPKSLIMALKYMKANKPNYFDLLPKAGETGTLEHRFLDHKGILEAKTGTLTGVGALSGLIVHPGYYESVIFSIIVNNSLLMANDIREHIDKIALYLAFTDPSC